MVQEEMKRQYEFTLLMKRNKETDSDVSHTHIYACYIHVCVIMHPQSPTLATERKEATIPQRQ